MTKEVLQKEFTDFLEEYNIHYKSNPNKYLIINKWNYKYCYLSNRNLIFNKMEELMDSILKNGY